MDDQTHGVTAVSDHPGEQAPDISVVIAAYNARDFVHMAVASATAQDAPGMAVEVIIIDDASTDDTLAVARALAEEDGRVRVVALADNGGPSAARNAGLDAARGTWIAVLDADDAFEDGHLGKLVERARATGADIVLANLRFHDRANGDNRPGDLGPGHGQPGYTAAQFVDRAQPMTGHVDWGLLKPLFRKSFMDREAIRYPLFSRHGEDFLLLVDALMKGARLVVSAAPSYRYTTRSSGWSRTRIDYSAQVDQARMLIERSDVSRDDALVAALQGRMRALARWEAHLMVEDCRRRRDFATMFRAAPSSAYVRSEIGRLAIGKLSHMVKARR